MFQLKSLKKKDHSFQRYLLSLYTLKKEKEIIIDLRLLILSKYMIEKCDQKSVRN